MKYKNYFDMVCGLFGGVVTYLLGGLNSEVGAKGLAKKAIMLHGILIHIYM